MRRARGRGPRPSAARTRVFLGLSVALAGCVEPGVASLDDIVADLARTGAIVRTIGTTTGYPFSVGATRVEVDGHEVLAYEYRDVADRENDSSAITGGGDFVHGEPADWTGTPRFWADGRVLVVYLGAEESVADRLTEVLGPRLDVGDGT